jgi:hypothetical protein
LPSFDPVKIVGVLEKHGVRYIIIGGQAAVMKGHLLPTIDLDVCIDTDPDNYVALAKALKELKAKESEPHKGEYVEREWTTEYLEAESVWLLGTRNGDLDVMVKPGGTDGYADLRKKATPMPLGPHRPIVAALEDVIRSKEAVGRERDLEALPLLYKLLERRRALGLREDE